MIYYQNYKHFKLPITINPLNYGKLIFQEDKIYVIQGNSCTFLIYEYEDYNLIKLYRKGDFIFEYKDHKVSANTFIRNVDNKNFTFVENILTSTSVDK
jgi:hypothetical protein